jgi:glycosyltransferase involved in cell wall biosynthesis
MASLEYSHNARNYRSHHPQLGVDRRDWRVGSRAVRSAPPACRLDSPREKVRSHGCIARRTLALRLLRALDPAVGRRLRGHNRLLYLMKRAARNPIRVAHVGGYALETVDGVQKTIAGLADHLPRSNIQVEFWSPSSEIAEPNLTHVGSWPALELPARRRPWNAVAGLPRATQEAVRQRERQVDLVHFHSVFVPENAWIARLLNIPYLTTTNGGYSLGVMRGRNSLAKWAWFRLYERSYIRAAAAVHTVSHSEIDDIVPYADRSRIITIPNAVDDQCLRRRITRPTGRDLLFLGRLAVEHKGLDLLLRGFAQSASDHKSRLIVAGPDFRGGRVACETLARKLGLGASVSFPGPVFAEEKWELIETCYAFVHTSRWEGLPFAVLEALALGRPALVTRHTNLAGPLSEVGAGIVVKDDPGSISAGILQLLSMSSDEYELMSQRARELVQDHFTWKVAAREMARQYHRIIERAALLRARINSDGSSREYLDSQESS